MASPGRTACCICGVMCQLLAQPSTWISMLHTSSIAMHASAITLTASPEYDGVVHLCVCQRGCVCSICTPVS